MTSTQPRRVYTLAEAAQRIGRSDRTLMRAEADGRLPAARRDELGHRIYIDHDVERMKLLKA